MKNQVQVQQQPGAVSLTLIELQARQRGQTELVLQTAPVQGQQRQA